MDQPKEEEEEVVASLNCLPLDFNIQESLQIPKEMRSTLICTLRKPKHYVAKINEVDKCEEFLNSFYWFFGTHHTHIFTQMTE